MDIENEYDRILLVTFKLTFALNNGSELISCFISIKLHGGLNFHL